jgi:hypothetical protein
MTPHLRNIRLCVFTAIVLIAALSTGCDEEQLGAINITLQKDLSGNIHLVVPEAGPISRQVSNRTQGIQLQSTATIESRSGEFENVNALDIGGITFDATILDGGFAIVRVTIPTQSDAEWMRMFTLMNAEDRAHASEALPIKVDSKTLGTLVKISIELPGTVVSSGVKGIGGTNSFKRSKASLMLDTITIQNHAASISGSPKPLVWHVTWE